MFGWRLPPGVSAYDVQGDHTVECVQCGARVFLDDAVGWSGGDEMFCDVRCLSEWAADHLERVVEWIKV